jgi:hypothetical protein
MLIATQLIKKFLCVLWNLKVHSLPCLQESATALYPEWDESSLHFPIIVSLQIHFNVPPSLPSSSLRLSGWNFVCTCYQSILSVLHALSISCSNIFVVKVPQTCKIFQLGQLFHVAGVWINDTSLSLQPSEKFMHCWNIHDYGSNLQNCNFICSVIVFNNNKCYSNSCLYS